MIDNTLKKQFFQMKESSNLGSTLYANKKIKYYTHKQ